MGYDFILSEANLSYEAKPSAINLPNLNINSYPKNMSPCNDFITYFFVDEMDIFTRRSRASIANYADERSSERERGCTTMRKPPAARQMSQLDDGGGRSTEHGIFRSDEESVCGLKQHFGI